jgi:hypothetical protein
MKKGQGKSRQWRRRGQLELYIYMSLLRRSSSFVLKLHDLDCVCQAIWGSIEKAQQKLSIYTCLY